MKELMEKYNMLLVRRDKEDSDYALKLHDLEKVSRLDRRPSETCANSSTSETGSLA
jgi:hypothetical protein